MLGYTVHMRNRRTCKSSWIVVHDSEVEDASAKSGFATASSGTDCVLWLLDSTGWSSWLSGLVSNVFCCSVGVVIEPKLPSPSRRWKVPFSPRVRRRRWRTAIVGLVTDVERREGGGCPCRAAARYCRSWLWSMTWELQTGQRLAFVTHSSIHLICSKSHATKWAMIE